MKKVCDINQYETPSKDRSKDGQVVAPTMVPVGAPATAAVTHGLAAPTAVPVGMPTAAAASKGLAAPMAGQAGASHDSCEEQKVVWRVASDGGACGNACGGTNGGCSSQGATGARGRAIDGAHAGCDEGRAGHRVGVRGSACRGANSCDGTHGALTGGGGSLNCGDGRSQGDRSNADGD
jgi:hypothetical protein